MNSIRILILLVLGVYCLNGQDHSINFDGSNDHIRIPDHSQLDLTSSYTLEAWIFPETFSWLAGIISKYQTNAANGYLLRLTHQAPHNGLGFDELVTGTGILSANQWYHIAAVKDGGSRSLYVNGVEQSLSGGALNVTANNNPIRIGSDYGSRYFDGRIDEVRIWNIARDQVDIVADMDSTLSGDENGLVAYYHFNEGEGDTLYDQTGNGHEGILVGEPSWADGYTVSSLLGDINFDEMVNIYDAVMLVAIMLNHEQGTELQLHSCDMNQDGLIDIEDIVLLFQWILEIDMNIRSELSTGEYQVSEEKVIISSDGDIAGFQIILSNQDMEIDLSLPPGWEYFMVQNKLVAYGMDGSSLPNNFPFFIQDHKAIQSIKLAGWNKTSAYATKAVVPRSFLLKAMPNPFNPGCKISFSVKESGSIDISLFDMAGKYVQSISNGQFFEGEHQIYWEPENISSGVYFIRINDGRDFQNKKVLYLK
jgi:hypothetical protein